MDLPDFDAITKNQTTARNEFNEGATGQQNEFLNRYRGAIAGQEGSQALADRLSLELGLPSLRENANKYQTLLTNMPFTQRQATQGFDVNQNQLDRLVSQKASELAPIVTSTGNALTAAESNLDRRLGYAKEDQKKALLPFQMESSMLSERLARESTGFSTGQQNELNSIIAKMNAGIQLSDLEWRQANALAEREQQYELAKMQNAPQPSQPGSNLINVGGKLYDPVSGQWISPPSGGGSGSGISFGNTGGSDWNITNDWG